MTLFPLYQIVSQCLSVMRGTQGSRPREVPRLTLPVCVPPVYCPFPGYLADGRVLLVGNMGMYIYRPYVRKVGGPRHARLT